MNDDEVDAMARGAMAPPTGEAYRMDGRWL
jgi:hypothetical protein